MQVMTSRGERVAGLIGVIGWSAIAAIMFIHLTPDIIASMPIATEARWIMYLGALLAYYIMGVKIPINAYRDSVTRNPM
jgi:hypothetical protein